MREISHNWSVDPDKVRIFTLPHVITIYDIPADAGIYDDFGPVYSTTAPLTQGGQLEVFPRGSEYAYVGTPSDEEVPGIWPGSNPLHWFEALCKAIEVVTIDARAPQSVYEGTTVIRGDGYRHEDVVERELNQWDPDMFPDGYRLPFEQARRMQNGLRPERTTQPGQGRSVRGPGPFD